MRNNIILKSKKAYVTVEAAIVLPFFIMVVLSIAFFIKVAFVYELVQHAITDTSNEIAKFSYIYKVSSENDIFKSNTDDLLASFDILKQNGESKSIKESSDIISFFSNDLLDDEKQKTIVEPFIKLLIKKHFKVGKSDENTVLKKLNIHNGLDGMDFSNSRLLEDDKNIEIVVSYKMRSPIPIGFLKEIPITQSILSKAWLTGELPDYVEDNISLDDSNNKADESIWDMKSDMKRGKKIQELEGRNLPFNFPVVSKNDSGHVIRITSIDLDEASYSKKENLKKRLKIYVDSVVNFNGGKCGNIEIKSTDIKSKELLLIIPEADVSDDAQKVIDEIIGYAKRNNVKMTIKKAYGKRNGK